MPKKHKRHRSSDEMQQLRREYRKALKEHRDIETQLALNKDVEGMKNLPPEPEEPSRYEHADE